MDLKRILMRFGRAAKAWAIPTPTHFDLYPDEQIVAQVSASSIWWGIDDKWTPLTLTSHRLLWKPAPTQFWASAEDIPIYEIRDIDKGQKRDWLKLVTASRIGNELKSGRRLLLLVWPKDEDEFDSIVAKLRAGISAQSDCT